MLSKSQVSVLEAAYKCRCPKAVVKSEVGGEFRLSTTLRTGHNPKCHAHPAPSRADKDRVIYEVPEHKPSAYS